MTLDRIGKGTGVALLSSAASVVVTLALAAVPASRVERPAPMQDGSAAVAPAVPVDFPGDRAAKQETFNRGLPMKVDQYTVLQRVDYKRGAWTFHFLVSFYITKMKEFEDKKHATTVSALCMDKPFVQSLKDSGPFLYQYLDPSGQTADVVIPKDDCGE